jgi:two-component system LytT family sensor kinase
MKAHASEKPEIAVLTARGKHIPLRTLLLLTGIFWVYVTLSNVLYAHSMQVNATQVTHAVLFSPWSVRVLQHVLLLPVLFACFWTSTRVGWAPLRGLPIQIALGVGFASLSFLVLQAAEALLMRLDPPMEAMPMQPKEAFGALWTASFTNFFLTYSFGIALVTGFTLYQGFRDSELRLRTLEQGWTAARLAALRMQLSPHTLFNLLHTIRGQINQEPQIARSMVVQLADLLRRLLSAGQRDFSTLAEELTFVRLYLELQQQRFADRLTVVLPNADAQPTLWVPSLILQPLVENAVIHGLAGHDQAVDVRIEVLTSSETLILRIVNTTAQDCAAGRDGIGLANVRERLAVQFDTQAALSAGPTNATMWVAQITMPALREFSPQLDVSPEVVSDGRYDRRR